MTTSHRQPPVPGYERSSPSFWGIFWFVVGFILVAAILHVLLWWIQGRLQLATAADRSAPSPLQVGQPRPEGPPLQPNPVHPDLPWQDLARLRDAEDRQLTTSGPLPDQPGFAHIPIDRAMAIVVQNHGQLPAAPAPTTQTTAPATGQGGRP